MPCSMEPFLRCRAAWRLENRRLLRAERRVEVANRGGRLKGDVDPDANHEQHDGHYKNRACVAARRCARWRRERERGDEERDRDVVVESEDERRGNSDGNDSQRAAGGEKKIEDRGFGRALRPPRIGLDMAERQAASSSMRKNEIAIPMGTV